MIISLIPICPKIVFRRSLYIFHHFAWKFHCIRSSGYSMSSENKCRWELFWLKRNYTRDLFIMWKKKCRKEKLPKKDKLFICFIRNTRVFSYLPSRRKCFPIEETWYDLQKIICTPKTWLLYERSEAEVTVTTFWFSCDILCSVCLGTFFKACLLKGS